MAAQQRGTNWTVLLAAGALIFSLGNSILGAVIGGTDKLEKRVTQIENDLTWKYLSKEYAAKDLGFIDRALADLKAGKVDKDVYEQKVQTTERILGFQRERIMDLDRRINGLRPSPQP